MGHANPAMRLFFWLMITIKPHSAQFDTIYETKFIVSHTFETMELFLNVEDFYSKCFPSKDFRENCLPCRSILAKENTCHALHGAHQTIAINESIESVEFSGQLIACVWVLLSIRTSTPAWV